jgi:hypothetical protein
MLPHRCEGTITRNSQGSKDTGVGPARSPRGAHVGVAARPGRKFGAVACLPMYLPAELDAADLQAGVVSIDPGADALITRHPS